MGSSVAELHCSGGAAGNQSLELVSHEQRSGLGEKPAPSASAKGTEGGHRNDMYTESDEGTEKFTEEEGTEKSVPFIPGGTDAK